MRDGQTTPEYKDRPTLILLKNFSTVSEYPGITRAKVRLYNLCAALQDFLTEAVQQLRVPAPAVVSQPFPSLQLVTSVSQPDPER